MEGRKVSNAGVAAFAIVTAIICAVVGVFVSQHSPVFGGIMAIGAPWSPARQTLIGSHVLAFGALGGGLGLLLGLLVFKYDDTNSTLGETGSALVALGMVLATAILVVVL